MKIKHILKILAVNIILLASFFLFLEIIFRSIYPEFIDNIHAPTISVGKKRVLSSWPNGGRTRLPYPTYEFDFLHNKPLMLILGDSISGGYGQAYEDIYWVKLQRMIDGLGSVPIKIVLLGGSGNNLSDSVEVLSSFVESHNAGVPIKILIYQFNYNDITPFNKDTLRKGNIDGGIRGRELFIKFANFRYEYLHKSVFIKLFNLYAGRMMKDLHGTCEERKIDAMGEYTWTFGSNAYRSESEELWMKFEERLTTLKNLSDRVNSRFVLLISPILWDIDKAGYHPFYNFYNYDFSCATINPKERLVSITSKLGVDIIDPSEYLKKHFEYRIKEGNFEPFFFVTDDNHFTPVASTYVAEHLLNYYVNNITSESNSFKAEMKP